MSDEITADLETYNVSFQVGGLFIVLVASALGVACPIALFYCGVQKSPAIQLTLLLFKAIGTGIIISTGFIHMLGEATDLLSLDGNPDLPPIFEYDSWNYVFCLATIVGCSVGDFITMRCRALKAGQVQLTFPKEADGNTFGSMGGCSHFTHEHEDVPAQKEGPIKGKESTTRDAALEEGRTASVRPAVSCDAVSVDIEGNPQSRVITLEAGILIHSVLIGLDLGLQSGSDYITLLIAIVFHQFFEGFALSQVLIEAQFDTIWPVIWAVAFYSVTTPVGIAIGIGTRQVLNEGSVASAITMGILDSISGGILIYIGLMTLMANWILNNKFLVKAHWSGPVAAFGGLCIGLAIMAFIGIWA